MAADHLRSEMNKEIPNSVINSTTFGQLAAHYQDRELPDDPGQARVAKAYPTAITYSRYLREWMSLLWEAHLLQDIH